MESRAVCWRRRRTAAGRLDRRRSAARAACPPAQAQKVVILLTGRYAGKKAVIVKNYDEGVNGRSYGHALVVGLAKEPRKARAGVEHSAVMQLLDACQRRRGRLGEQAAGGGRPAARPRQNAVGAEWVEAQRCQPPAPRLPHAGDQAQQPEEAGQALEPEGARCCRGALMQRCCC